MRGALCGDSFVGGTEVPDSQIASAKVDHTDIVHALLHLASTEVNKFQFNRKVYEDSSLILPVMLPRLFVCLFRDHNEPMRMPMALRQPSLDGLWSSAC